MSSGGSLQTLKEGTLYKRGKINTEWRQRQFVLNGKQLSYFKGGRHVPSGIIELREVRRVSDINADGIFQIETPVRTFDIRGETRDDLQRWIDAIREAKSKLNQSLPK